MAALASARRRSASAAALAMRSSTRTAAAAKPVTTSMPAAMPSARPSREITRGAVSTVGSGTMVAAAMAVKWKTQMASARASPAQRLGRALQRLWATASARIARASPPAREAAASAGSQTTRPAISIPSMPV